MFYLPLPSNTNKNGILPTPNYPPSLGDLLPLPTPNFYKSTKGEVGALPEKVLPSALDGCYANPALCLAEPRSREKVKFRKIVPYNISEFLTPLALAV